MFALLYLYETIRDGKMVSLIQTNHHIILFNCKFILFNMHVSLDEQE